MRFVLSTALFVAALAALVSSRLPISAADAPIARIPAVSDTSTDPTIVAPFADIRARGGKPLNLQLITGNAPKMGKAMLGMAYSIRFDATTPRWWREIAILRTAQMMYVSTALTTKALRIEPEEDGRTSVQGAC